MPTYVNGRVDGLLGRFLGGILALALGLLALFLFTTFALVAAGFAVLGLGRLWWLQRSRPERPDSDLIEAEYSVDDDGGAREPDAILPPERRGA